MKAIITYVPVVNRKATGHFRSFKNAVFDFKSRTSGHQVTRFATPEQQVGCWIERRNGSSEVYTLSFTEIEIFATTHHLLSAGEPDYEAAEPDQASVTLAFKQSKSARTTV